MSHFGKCLLAAFLSGTCGLSYATCTAKEVHEFENKWKAAYNIHNADMLSNLYAKDAVFMGAFYHEPLSTEEARRHYFTSLFNNAKKNKESLAVRFDNSKTHIHVLAGGAASSGIYILEERVGNQVKSTPIRFTMVFRDTPQNCELIVHQVSLSTKGILAP